MLNNFDTVDIMKLRKSTIIGLSCFLLFLIYYFIVKKYNFSIPCAFHEITGYECPGCGITRMLFAILQFNFYEAIKYNILLFSSLPFIIYFGAKHYWYWLNNKKVKPLPKKYYYIILIIVLLFGVIRNIECFSFLSSY